MVFIKNIIVLLILFILIFVTRHNNKKYIKLRNKNILLSYKDFTEEEQKIIEYTDSYSLYLYEYRTPEHIKNIQLDIMTLDENFNWKVTSTIGTIPLDEKRNGRISINNFKQEMLYKICIDNKFWYGELGENIFDTEELFCIYFAEKYRLDIVEVGKHIPLLIEAYAYDKDEIPQDYFENPQNLKNIENSTVLALIFT